MEKTLQIENCKLKIANWEDRKKRLRRFAIAPLFNLQLKIYNLQFSILLSLLVFLSPASSQAGAPSQNEIRSLVLQLGNESYAQREAAQQKLLKLGRVAAEEVRRGLG